MRSRISFPELEVGMTQYQEVGLKFSFHENALCPISNSRCKAIQIVDNRSLLERQLTNPAQKFSLFTETAQLFQLITRTAFQALE
jgi:hypothetical protein